MLIVFIIIKAAAVSSENVLLLLLFHSDVSPREKQVLYRKVTVLSGTVQPDICFIT